ncbi:disease resistance protein RGA2-like [Vigna angularis]|uniref:disease resistance protein RGA2-like n=1 Tax=Phaseolus angularis TaxID=3914 RepID=UPI000809D4D2|nr:disease resistance protein RGA2-like [Vigna angularis]
MAESLLFSFAESLLRKLATAAVQEASLGFGVDRQLQQMKATTALIKAVLLDAEQKNPHSSALSEWLVQVKRVFSEAEDIVDDFDCEALRKHVANTYGGSSRKVRRFFSTSNPVVYRLRMAHHIQDINTRLAKLADQRSMFGLQIIDHVTRVVQLREMTHSHVNPSNVTGREHDKREIVKLLVQDDDRESLSIIPIVGMGGLGKTTLAKLVFNDTTIHACFQLRMWVCVSNDFELRNVLIKILSSAPNPASVNFNSFETEQLQNHLRNKLQDQKFLLVLDDVWNEDPARWDELKEIMDLSVKGSKILVTTRSHAVVAAMHTKSSNSYLLECLSEEDSLSLFLKSAFEDGDEKKHPQFSEIGKEIVKKCGGLPLAVKTLGSSLFSKFDKKEWESIRDNEIWNSKQNEKGIFPALKLSYDQLPSYLKPCFASFSLYQQDSVFTAAEVCMLWGALGFLPPPKQGESMTDISTQFLHELWTRSFLLDFVDLGGDCYFKLHDLVSDLAVFVGKGEFERIHHRNPKISENIQHLAFEENNFYGETLLPTSPRTVIFLNGGSDKDFLKTLLSRCKCLRYLNLKNCEYESLPRCIGKLKHLRFLSLAKNEKLKELPYSLCKLQNLQTLFLNGCIKLQMLPKGLENLISLRHLAITTTQAAFPEEVIAKLTSLENLYISYCDNLRSLFEQVQLLTLKTFHLCNCGSLKSVSFHAIRNLEGLVIKNCDNLDLSLGLGSQISNSRLKYVVLTDLPQLLTLPQWLQGCANTLRSLLIQQCMNLKEFPEWLPTLIHLKVLEIGHCPNLLSFPLHHLTNLEDLQIIGCPALSKRFHPIIGYDWHRISHVKKVYIGRSL